MADFIPDSQFMPDASPAPVRAPSFIPDEGFISDEEKYGEGITPALKAFGLGAARSGTFGLSDELLVNSGAMKPEEIKAYKEHQELPTVAGEIGGIFASPATRALGTVARDISEGAQALLPEAASTVGQLASRAATQGLGSAVEGAAYGLGQSVSEHALGDPDLNGEKIASNVGTGLIFGGGLGSLLGAAEVGVPSAVKSAKAALSKLYDVSVGLPGEEPGILGKAYAQASSFVSGKPYDQIVDAMQDRMRSLVKPEEQKEVIEGFSQGLKDQHSKVNKALFDANKNARLQETASYLKDVPGEAALPEMTKAVSSMKNMIQEMRSEPDLYPQSYPRILEQITDRVSQEVGSESSAFDVFKSLNDLKGRLDEEIDYGALPTGGDLRAQGLITNLRRSIKNSLEEPSIWGEAASRQAAFNDAQAQFLSLTGKKGLFRKSFMDQALGKGGKLTYEVSPQKVETYLKQIGSVRGEAKSQALKQYLETSDNLVNEIEKTYQSLPDKTFDKDSVQSLIGKNKEFSEKATQQSEFNKSLNALGAGAHNVPLAETGALAAGVLGHPVLGAALETANMLKAPGLGIQRLAKIERLLQDTSRAIEKGASAIFKAGTKAIEPLTGFGGTKIEPEQRDKKFKKVTSQLNELGNNPEKLMSSLEQATQNLHPHAPQISQGLQLTMVRATQFLQSKLPGNNIPNAPLSPKYEPSHAELFKWHKYFSAVHDPINALHEVATHTLTPETMETLSAVYPKLLSEMQSQVTDKMTDAISKNKSVPYGTKMMLSMFLVQDLVLSLDSKSMLANQNMLATATQAKALQEQGQMSGAKGKSQGKINQANRMLTPMQDATQRKEA